MLATSLQMSYEIVNADVLYLVPKYYFQYFVPMEAQYIPQVQCFYRMRTAQDEGILVQMAPQNVLGYKRAFVEWVAPDDEDWQMMVILIGARIRATSEIANTQLAYQEYINQRLSGIPFEAYLNGR